MIQYSCRYCKRSCVADDALQGQLQRCPNCQKFNVVSAPAGKTQLNERAKVNIILAVSGVAVLVAALLVYSRLSRMGSSRRESQQHAAIETASPTDAALSTGAEQNRSEGIPQERVVLTRDAQIAPEPVRSNSGQEISARTLGTAGRSAGQTGSYTVLPAAVTPARTRATGAMQQANSQGPLCIDFEELSESTGQNLLSTISKGFVFTSPAAGQRLAIWGPHTQWHMRPSNAVSGVDSGCSLRFQRSDTQQFDLFCLDLFDDSAQSAVITGATATGLARSWTVNLDSQRNFCYGHAELDWKSLTQVDVVFWSGRNGAGEIRRGSIDNLWINARKVDRVATPTYSLSPGVYPKRQRVTISCATPGARIYYTTDGAAPSIFSRVYDGSPIELQDRESLIWAFAVKAQMAPSDMPLASYYVGKLSPPRFVSQSLDMVIKRGERRSLTVQLDDPAKAKLRWQMKSAGGWTDVPDAGYPRLETPVMKETAQFRCIAANLAGESVSPPITVTVQ